MKCQMEGCACSLHHMCQTEWESTEEGREAHGSKNLCAYHHSSLTNCPSCSMPASRKAATPSGASALRAVPQYDATKYPGIAAVAAMMNNAMACWKTIPALWNGVVLHLRRCATVSTCRWLSMGFISSTREVQSG